MKFEMKKRILALALAGTTAFSVFGAAMSANAAEVVWDGGTHSYSQDGDYYVKYNPAGVIHWTTAAVEVTVQWPQVPVYTVNEVTTTNTGVDDQGRHYIAAGTTLYVQDPDAVNFLADDEFYTIKDVKDLPGYYATLEAYMKAQGYTKAEINADSVSFTLGTGANAVQYTLYTDAAGNYYAFTANEISNGEAINLTPFDGTGVGVDANDPTRNTDVYYQVNGDGSISNKVEMAILNAGANGTTVMNASLAQIVSDRKASTYYIAELVNANTVNATNYYVTSTGQAQIGYVTDYTGAKNTVWTDMDYDVLNNTVGGFDSVMDEEVRNGVVYLYDYYYDNSYPASVDADEFADGWADGTLADTLSKAYTPNSPTGTINPESGYSYRSVRGEVLDAWEDFLDNLGIADPNMEDDELTMWAEDTYDNYLYTYWDANVVTEVKYDKTTGAWEVTIQNGRNVDIYNFGDLIEDILDLAPAKNPDMDKTQTSELVYLMQQYEKYTDGFVDIVPVDTDDWGDLLVALAEAPTSDEFSTSNNYKRYTNRVEDLVEEYEEADTNAAVKLAEQHLYDFVTDRRC